MQQLLTTLLIALGATLLQANEISLFDGKTLEGWYGDPKFWKVEDGTITAESSVENPCDETTYLRFTKHDVSDFELTLKYRILSENGNSGIQYRSKQLDDTYTILGYQADFENGKRYSGILYDQGTKEIKSRRIIARRGQKVVISEEGEKAITPLESGEKAQESIKNGEWNTYKIVAKGTTLMHFINGHKTIEVEDNDKKEAELSGCLALQLHKGPPMKVQFKDLHFTDLSKKETPSDAK